MKKIAILNILIVLFFNQQVLADPPSPAERVLSCAMTDSLQCLEEVLEQEENVNVNLKDNQFGNTPLHWAVRLRNYLMMSILINHGADLETMNDNGETPLHYAVKTNFHPSYHALRMLIEFGAEPDVVNKEGVDPFCLVVSRNHNRAVAMLIGAGVNVNRPCRTEERPLGLAIRHESSELVRMLLDAGAKVDDLNDMAHANMIEVLKDINL